MLTKNILIFTAVAMETRAVQKSLRGSGCRVHPIGVAAGKLPAVHEVEGAHAIVVCGVAGGLNPSLAIGDIVLDDPGRLVSPGLPFQRGVIYSTTTIAATPTAKHELFRSTGASAVDMEQAVVVDFAKPLRIPVIGLRAISDTFQDAIDPSVLGFVDDAGNPRPTRIALGLLRRPALVPQLWKLNANMQIALRSLSSAIRLITADLTSR